MTNGLSRRALAAGAAALATSTLAQDVADARRGPTATHHLVIDGQVTVERNRVTIDRGVHAFRVGSDGTSERIHDHGRFVPPAGGDIDYRLAGLEQVGDGSRGLVGAPRMFSFRATGGSHDPQAGRLVLEGEAADIDGPQGPAEARRLWFLTLLTTPIVLAVGFACESGC